ncbi:nucleotide pyrophosphohydrolase [Clostridium sp. AF19-22AC]|jgi:NTP pyrophosphatase (non-canonical NTP hydrolase)|uniref:NTP pyrophosphatase (Non-canonical NTP hydrolase) n=1 Tax=Faecalicatena orotica TaxID=1544 RepID=A0A2Y9B8R4_9FIRM|nr:MULTISPECIES: nucleotide pyrophosphohydrolase [Clostridia]PWJ32412.1 NTP pyrophosphatase (non-canonical NTP hydrolase) [Faecalicatena orotica]RHR25605.1 nucleotide pyrophosphohydrolase [Clostridium sp. AF19-22AC]SSA54246.1 NTP pyrophosphatase, house-cleaning of non-canonical NTPs [Faecalicatena orotica]
MEDKITTLSEVKKYIQDFSDARGWRKDQNAKDLVMALTVEASELAEIFMWLHSDEADSVREDEGEFEHLKEEVADVFWYLCRICEHFGIDLSAAVESKAGKNAVKYPVK